MKRRPAKPLPFRSSGLRLQQLHAFVRRFEAERERAATEVDAILRRTPRELWQTLVEHPDLQTGGAIIRLGVIVSDELTRNPGKAEDLAMLAVSLAEALPPGSYPAINLAQIRALAWQDLGKTFSFRGRHDEALSAFAQAELEIGVFPLLSHVRAVIRLNLSLTYQETGRHSEALALLQEASETFRAHGDTHLLVLARFYEGILLQRLQRYREAREKYLLLIASSSDIRKDSLAAIHHAIGFCSIELQDYDDAEDNLLKAVVLHTQLGFTLEAMKGELGRGRLYLRRGACQKGIDHLRGVRHHFLKHSLAEEAGLCGLDMVEGMLQLGQTEQAEALARTIMNEFLAASLNERAITTLGYLSEAIASRKATPRMATDVREYVLSLQTDPEREFTGLRLPAKAAE